MIANMIVPTRWGEDIFCPSLYELCIAYPYIIRDNVKIHCFYGSFSAMIWTGGRANTAESTVYDTPPLSKNELLELRDYYNNTLNLPMRFTWSNLLINEKRYLDDTYCNIVAEIFNNGKNEIVVSSPLLEDYLRTYYSNYKFISSIQITTPDFSNYNFDAYDWVVMNRAKTIDLEYMKSIPQSYRKKIEILCNDDCPLRCPKRAEHHYATSKAILNCELLQFSQCPDESNNNPFPNHISRTFESYVSAEKIQKDYLPLGYEYFKLAGRSNKGKIFTNWLYYIIKPEYHQDIIQSFIN